MEHDLAGAFIWSVEMDDFRGTCGQGDYPLLSNINKVLRSKQNDVPSNVPDTTIQTRFYTTAQTPPKRKSRRKGTENKGIRTFTYRCSLLN